MATPRTPRGSGPARLPGQPVQPRSAAGEAAGPRSNVVPLRAGGRGVSTGAAGARKPGSRIPGSRITGSMGANNEWVEKTRRAPRDFFNLFKGQSPEFYWVFFVTILILCGGLIMVLSSSGIVGLNEGTGVWSYTGKQLFFVAVGFVGLGIASKLPMQTYWRLAIGYYFVWLLLEFVPFLPFIGKTVNGNTAWINLGLFTLQPSEFMKLAMILVVARLMTTFSNESEFLLRIPGTNFERYLPTIWRFLLVVGLAVFPVVVGKDMGTSMVMGLIIFGMSFLADIPRRDFKWPLIVASGAIAIGLFGGTNRIARIIAWLWPDSTQGQMYSWQAQHGIWAIAGGGLTGVGLGNSKLKWSWIPEVQNDYIFAVIGEELGMAGALLTIGLFVLLAVRLYKIFLRCDTLFARMTTMGVILWITVQAFINIAVVLQLLPVLGVPLPLVSAGGSSMVSGIAAIGVVLSFERENHLRLGGRPAVGRSGFRR